MLPVPVYFTTPLPLAPLEAYVVIAPFVAVTSIFWASIVPSSVANNPNEEVPSTVIVVLFVALPFTLETSDPVLPIATIAAEPDAFPAVFPFTVIVAAFVFDRLTIPPLVATTPYNLSPEVASNLIFPLSSYVPFSDTITPLAS